MPSRRRSSVVEAHDIYLKYHRHHQEEEAKEDTKLEDVRKDLGGRDHKVRGVHISMTL